MLGKPENWGSLLIIAILWNVLKASCLEDVVHRVALEGEGITFKK